MDSCVGRTAEVHQLRSWMDAAAAGHPGLVLVEGEPGIGKTSLISHAVRRCGLRAAWARADPAETALDLGVVHQLTGPAPTSSAPGDAIAAGGRLLALLDRLQGEGPDAAVLVVDDVHWADEPSLQALMFAFRRLRADRVLLVLAARPSWTGRGADAVRSVLSSEAAHRVTLGGLDLAAVQQLAEQFGHGGLGPTALRDLLDHTAGHPLHLCELFRSLPTAALATTAGLPAPPSLAATVQRRLAGMSAPARDLVTAVAVLGGAPSLVQAAAVAGLTDPSAALAEALDRGLLGRPLGADAGVVGAHRLVSAAVREATSPDALARLHRSAAAVAPDRGTALRHRVAAADPGDVRLVEDLVEHAADSAAAGAWTAAAADCARAAELEVDPATRRSLWLTAAEHSLTAVDVGQATRWLGHAADDPSPRATYLRGRLALTRGAADDAQALLTAAWEAAGALDDRGTAARSAHALAWLSLQQGSGADVVRWVEEVMSCGDPGLTQSSWGLLALGHGITGNARRGLATLPAGPRPLAAEHLDVAIASGALRLYVDDLAGARSDLRAVLDATRRLGGYPLAFTAHANLAEVEQRAGDWDAAVLHGQLAVAAIADVEQLWLRAPSLALAAAVPARRGQWEEATRLVDAATLAARRVGDVLGTTYAAAAAARLADSRADWAGVVAVTDVLVELVARGVDGPAEPGILDWQELRAEALVRLGRLHRAEALLADMAAAARSREHRSGAAAVARVRGLLETARLRRPSAESAFARAAQGFAELGYAFGSARTALDWGTAASRWRQPDTSARLLGEATDELSRLGAQPYLDRVPVPGADEPAAGGSAPPAPALRPQELAIAMLVAEGRTNREIAQEMMLSVKTVEFHLSQVFRRHHLRSRSQLAALVSR